MFGASIIQTFNAIDITVSFQRTILGRGESLRSWGISGVAGNLWGSGYPPGNVENAVAV